MNIEAAAKQIMSARHSDAFTQEVCEQILRDNQKGGDALCHVDSAASSITSTSHVPLSNAAPTVQPVGAAQTKPESWQDWTVQRLDELLDLKFELGPVKLSVPEYFSKLDYVVAEIRDSIERSHAAQPQGSEYVHEYATHLPETDASDHAASSDQPPFTPPPSGAQLAWQETVQEGDQPSGSGRTTDEWDENRVEQMLHNHDTKGIAKVHNAELLREVVRLLASIFFENGKSLLGGSPPTFWTPRLIAQVATENIKRNDAEVRKPLVDALKLLANEANYMEPNFNPVEVASDALAKVKEGQ